MRIRLKDGTNQGKAFELRDKDGVYDAIQSYVTLGEKDFIKSKQLVEEIKVDDEGNETGTYVCIKYELTDGNVFRFFFERPQLIVIDNLYKLYKKNQKTPAKQG